MKNSRCVAVPLLHSRLQVLPQDELVAELFLFQGQAEAFASSKDFCISQALTGNLDKNDQTVHPKGSSVFRGDMRSPQVPVAAGPSSWRG